MTLLVKVEQFVTDSFQKAGKEGSLLHLTRTAYWLKELQPDADEYMQIAALTHDIERAYREDAKIDQLLLENGFQDPIYLQLHQEHGAEIIGKFLQEQKVDPIQIDRVKAMVAYHEIGGNEEQNMIKDADSISFFENNVSHFIQKRLPFFDKENIRLKFDWMYNRITSTKAKQIAAEWYRKALLQLDAQG
jgi:hypothetical protein